MATNIKKDLNEIFLYIQLASLHGSKDNYKKSIIKYYKSFQEKLNEHYTEEAARAPGDESGNSKIFEKYKRAYKVVADVILANNAEDRAIKARDGIQEINSLKRHIIGYQAKIVDFLKDVLQADERVVSADLGDLDLPITDVIQIKSKTLNRGDLDRLKNDRETVSIEIAHKKKK